MKIEKGRAVALFVALGLKNADKWIVGLNQTKDEKDVAAIRLNWVALRENDSGFTEFKCVAVAECRPLARVCTVSCW